MQRVAVDFARDDEGHWLAVLSCAHTQHVRHDPPFTNRPWTQTAAGREQMLGTEFTCLKCTRLEVPDGLVGYNATPWFDAETVPAGLTRDHSTKAGVWGRIEVAEGILEYAVTAPFSAERLLEPGIDGWIPPEALHRVSAKGAVKFRVHFMRSERTSGVA